MASAAAVPVAPTIAKERVESVIERWRVAQESGDFEAYSALYGSSFRGVKLVGDSRATFDRAGWLRDRRQMFQRDMKVGVSGLKVFTGERSAFVTFVQDWSTARFHDVGPKRIELALRGNELSIVSEEMLASVTGAVGKVKAPPPEELALLWKLPRGYGVVLKRGSIATQGKVSTLSTESASYLMAKDAAGAALGPVESFRARTLDLYGVGGFACSAKVSSFRVLGGFTSPIEELPEDNWKALGDELYLVAVVEPDDSKCQPLWARAQDLPKPTVFRSQTLTGDELALAERQLAKTKTAREMQKDYQEYRQSAGGTQAPASWLDVEPTERLGISLSHPQTNAKYAVLERFVGAGCDGFRGYALGLFKQAAPEWIDLTGSGAPYHYFPLRPLFGMAPEAAVTLSSGGPVYLISGEGIYADTGAGFVPVMTIGPIRTTCSC
jgi:hypothetical protein